MTCECMNWCLPDGADKQLHHNPKCEKYRTEKFPHLFYYEDGVDSWIPVWGDISEIVLLENLEPGDVMEVEFKRIDLTDAEFHALPEA